MNIRDEFEQMLTNAIDETGVVLLQSPSELADYMAERADKLAGFKYDAGFSRAISLERNSIAIAAGLSLTDGSRMADQRLIGMISGALRIAALALP